MFFCLLSSFLFLLVYSLMQNSYYNDNRRHGVSLTLKNSLCASLFARAHEPPRDQRMYNIISFFFCYFLLPAYISPLSLFYSLQLPSPRSSSSTLSFLPLSLIVISFIYFFLPLLLGVLRLLLVCSPFLDSFFFYLLWFRQPTPCQLALVLFSDRLNPCIIRWLCPDLLLVVAGWFFVPLVFLWICFMQESMGFC